jgi:hypothetical protein
MAGAVPIEVPDGVIPGWEVGMLVTGGVVVPPDGAWSNCD